MEQAQPCNQRQREKFARLVEEAKKREVETLDAEASLDRRIENEFVPQLAQSQAGASELIVKIGTLRKELDVAEKTFSDLGFYFSGTDIKIRWDAPEKLQKAVEAEKRSVRIERQRSLKKYDLAILGIWSVETTDEAKGIVEQLL